MLEEDPNEESYYKMGKASGVPVSECNKTTWERYCFIASGLNRSTGEVPCCVSGHASLPGLGGVCTCAALYRGL